jgi:hypothetical protein
MAGRYVAAALPRHLVARVSTAERGIAVAEAAQLVSELDGPLPSTWRGNGQRVTSGCIAEEMSDFREDRRKSADKSGR